ncbi:hypothetical protein JCM11957_04270 [Caminibacter profundus]
MRLKDISILVTQDIAVDILASLGVNIKPNRNFSLREDDKNPSASMYMKNGKVRFHDFGTGFDGDLIDTLKEFFNIPYQEAKHLIASYLGLSKFNNISSYKKEFKPIKEEILSCREIKAIWDRYKPLSSLSEEKTKEIINKLIPVEYFITAKKEDKKAFYNAVRFDPKQDEPVVATFTPTGNILTIRHRRYKTKNTIIKWKSLKNTEANKYTQIRIKNNDPIFIIEGTHDYTTALLLGINFIALPSKNYKTFKNEELALLKEKYDFIILPDLDFKNENDEKYKKFKKELANSLKTLIPQLEPYTKKTITIWNLKERFFHFKGIEKVKDLSDLCEVSDLYDSTYLRVFHLLASFIAKDQTDLEVTLDLEKGEI